jgi:predicted phosphate transport protein (TIGR00153 family)
MMLPNLLPREVGFFDYFDKHIALTAAGARILEELVTDGGDRAALATRIKEIEHETDTITHQCVESLHKTFITPLDRHEIHQLITKMDDVIDFVDAAAGRIVLYKLTEMTPEARELASLLAEATTEMEHAVRGLRKLKNADAIREKCMEVNRIENESDAVLRVAIAHLFENSNDPIQIIKWKEIYEILEGATDRCEDVVNIIEGIMLEHG